MTRILRAIALGAVTSLLSLTVANADQFKVVASFSIIGEFAKQVGGEHIALITLVGPGADAHVYEPAPRDVVAMADADVVLINGLNFDGFISRLAAASGTRAPIIELSKGVETITASGGAHDHAVEESGRDHDSVDPHAFQSAANARTYVQNIAAAFCEADAAGCDTYKANAASYSAQLEALDAEVKATVASIPDERRTIITSHDAFGYFAQAYGLRFLAPEGISTESEASAADVAALIRQIRDDKASAIFVENVTNPRLVEQIAAEAGLKIGGKLYSDALSDGPPAATYIDLMRHNAATIKHAIMGM